MAVSIEPQAVPETCLPCKLLFGHALDIGNELAVRFIQLPQYVGERKILFALRHQRIERIDATVLCRVPRWSAFFDDKRQMLQRLLFPLRHMRKDVFHRPIAHDTRFCQLCL